VSNAVLIGPFLFPKLWDSAPIVVLAWFLVAAVTGVVVGLLIYLLGVDISRASAMPPGNEDASEK